MTKFKVAATPPSRNPRTFRVASEAMVFHVQHDQQTHGKRGSGAAAAGITTEPELRSRLATEWRDVPGDEFGPALSSFSTNVTIQVDGPRVERVVRPRLKWSDPDRAPEEDRGDRYIEARVSVLAADGEEDDSPTWEADVFVDGYGTGDASSRTMTSDRSAPPSSLPKAKEEALEWAVANALELAQETYRATS